jgi:Na+/melibiose symporter-like transporter
MCYVFAPIILVVVGSACLIGYKLDAKRQGEIRSALEELDATRNNAVAAEALSGSTETASPA